MANCRLSSTLFQVYVNILSGITHQVRITMQSFSAKHFSKRAQTDEKSSEMNSQMAVSATSLNSYLSTNRDSPQTQPTKTPNRRKRGLCGGSLGLRLNRLRAVGWSPSFCSVDVGWSVNMTPQASHHVGHATVLMFHFLICRDRGLHSITRVQCHSHFGCFS